MAIRSDNYNGTPVPLDKSQYVVRCDDRHYVATEGTDTCGLCGLPGAKKRPNANRWPGERDSGTDRVHVRCEFDEAERAYLALSPAEREAFLEGLK